MKYLIWAVAAALTTIPILVWPDSLPGWLGVLIVFLCWLALALTMGIWVANWVGKAMREDSRP